MKRTLYTQLLHWKDSETRKPLMLYGARQVGKTYILKEFGNKEFKNTVYINCFNNEAVRILFRQIPDMQKILTGLSAIAGAEIIPEDTLIIFDEAQEIPEVVTSLKYFCEDCPQYFVAVAGSLLGVLNLTDNSFPVGKVDILHLYPMTFYEFLEGIGESEKAGILASRGNREIINSLAGLYKDLLRQYYFVGGMPEAVMKFTETGNIQAVRQIQSNIILAYQADIAKHAGSLTQRCRLVFESVPSQLAKENKKFIFGAIKPGARAREYEEAIQWLVDAGLIYQVFNVSKPAYPLGFYIERNSFKVFLLDVGLLGAMQDIDPALILIGDSIFSEYKGAFTENYVFNQLLPMDGINKIAYYSKANSTVEIDFLVQYKDRIIPLEVKAEENVRSKSFRQFLTVDNADSGMKGVRYSMKGFADQGWMENVPLFDIEAPFE